VTAPAAKPVDPAVAPSPGAAAKAGPAVGDKVAVGSDGGSVTVSAVEDNVSAGRLFGAGKGFKYIAAQVAGCAGPNEKEITFESGYFLLRLDDGTLRDHGVGAKKPELSGETVPPGKCLSGWITFTVPDGALATGVIYDGSARMTWTVPIPKGAHPTTTTTTRPGSKPTTTTTGASSSAKATTTTTKPKVTTTTTTRSGSTTTTTRSSSSTTTTTGKRAGSTTTTTGKTAGSTTTTTGKAAGTPTTVGTPR
jgi:hypothetical protein